MTAASPFSQPSRRANLLLIISLIVESFELYMNHSSLDGIHPSPCRTSDSGKFFLQSYHVHVK